MENNDIIILNDTNFNEFILQNNKNILVDFWAEWCTPCKIMNDLLLEIKNEYYNKIIISKLDIDNNPIITTKYNIRSIPSLFIFKNGNIIANKTGVLSRAHLKEFIDNNI